MLFVLLQRTRTCARQILLLDADGGRGAGGAVGGRSPVPQWRRISSHQHCWSVGSTGPTGSRVGDQRPVVVALALRARTGGKALPGPSGQPLGDLIGAHQPGRGRDASVTADGQHVAEPAGLQLGAKDRIGAISLVPGPTCRTPAFKARLSIPAASAGLVANSMSSGTPATAQR
jgi:hypothetical protein